MRCCNSRSSVTKSKGVGRGNWSRPPREGLTPVEARALEAHRRLTKFGVPPSCKQIQQACGYDSHGPVVALMAKMGKMGILVLANGRWVEPNTKEPS